MKWTYASASIIIFSGALFAASCLKPQKVKALKDNPWGSSATLMTSRSYLSPQETANKMTLKILGMPYAPVARQLEYNVNDYEDLPTLFQKISQPGSPFEPQFVDWVVNILRDRWKIQVMRNDGTCEHCTWYSTRTHSSAFMEFNRVYLSRHPHRRYLDPETPGIFGGDDFDLPTSTDDIPGDAPYAIYELEPLLLGAALVLHDKPFSWIVNSNLTVRSKALLDFEGLFKEAEVLLEPENLVVRHWSGTWDLQERFTPDKRELRGGILNTIGFLRTYHRERSWAARGIYQSFLCQEIMAAPEPPKILKLQKIGDPNPLEADQSCRGCHYMLDGLANLRMQYGIHSAVNYWGAFAYYPADSSRLFNLKSPEGLEAFNLHHGSTVVQWPMTHYLLMHDGSYAPVASMDDLGEAIASNTNFHKCQVRAFVEDLMGNLDEKQKDLEINRALEAYLANKQSMKAAVKALLSSEVFREAIR